MRIIIFLFIYFASSASFAELCSETPEWNKKISPETEKIKNLDKQGEKDLKAALENLQKISKKNDKQMAAYLLEVVNKPELSQLQKDRKNLGLNMINLINSGDCKAIRENNKKLHSAISLQWIGTLTAVQADTQLFLAKNMSAIPDINATTETGEKVVLHANGTWSEAQKK
ncbi:MAG TPA: hypothetical protein VN030_06040 [Cellvibrio sp.]|nr:hypothetical protein [Cellvibrio sp.]